MLPRIFNLVVFIGVLCVIPLCVNLPFIPQPTEVHCSVRRDISPCTCNNYPPKEGTKGKPWILVKCQKMKSMAHVIEVLADKFDKSTQIMLHIEYSNLDDMATGKFRDVNSTTILISLQHNELKNITFSSFEGLTDVRSLTLSDNKITEFPGGLFRYMPNIETLDISRTLITSIKPTDFENLKNLTTLLFSDCNLTVIEKGTFPPTLGKVHLGSNNLTLLNGSLSYHPNVQWMQVQNNHIKQLEDELPDRSPNSKLKYLDISGNELDHLPESFQNLYHIDHLLAYRNKIVGLDNILSKMSFLEDLDLGENRIQTLSPTEFANTRLTSLNLAFNEITSLNGSLVPLQRLCFLNITHNKLTEFSLQDVRGLFNLNSVELSYNKISKLVGYIDNSIESEMKIGALNLDHNEISVLDGSLSIVQGLTQLNISFNKLTSIPPQFLHGLDVLRVLDISHNHLHSLQETSKAILPSLSDLNASYNELNILAEDFHGFPTLCNADLSYNKIRSVKPEFLEKTHCKLHGVNNTLRINIQGNPALCIDTVKEIIGLIKSRNNNTEFNGSTQCSPPKEELKYNVTNGDSSPITVITLDK